MHGIAACIYTAFIHLGVPAILYRPAMAVPNFLVHESKPCILTSSRFAGPLALPVNLAAKVCTWISSRLSLADLAAVMPHAWCISHVQECWRCGLVWWGCFWPV